jgi:hypothetical protein
MNERRKLGEKVENTAIGFSKMLIIFYQNGYRQIPEDHILLSAIRTSILTYGRNEGNKGWIKNWK